MKKIQIIRRIVQLIYIALLFTTFFQNFKLFFVILLLSTVLGGAFFCGWLCPFGTAQEIISKIGNKLHIKKLRVPKKIHKYLIFLRYGISASAIIGFAFFTPFDARIALLDILHGSKIAIISYVSFFLFLISALFIQRPFCNYFCPYGANFGLRSIARIFTIRRHEDLCINCKICDKTCPMHINISEHGDVRSLQCISCMACVSNCPKKGALTYQLIDFKQIIPNIKKLFQKKDASSLNKKRERKTEIKK